MNTLETETETETEGERDLVPVLLLRVEEAAQRLGIGRTSMYRLIGTGNVESVQIGALRRIPVPCLEEYVDQLRHPRQGAPSANAGT